MSLPKELLDQLLSGYLDDALTADERTRVEQLLRTNPEVADELEQLRDLRRSLQVLARVDAGLRLDSGFADRVLGAAVARAREEGLADEHPLVVLAEQPMAQVAPAASEVSLWRVAAVMVGLAASIAIAVLVSRSDQSDAMPKAGSDLMVSADLPRSDRPSMEDRPDEADPDSVPTPLTSPGPASLAGGPDSSDRAEDVAMARDSEAEAVADATVRSPVVSPATDSEDSVLEREMNLNGQPQPAESIAAAVRQDGTVPPGSVVSKQPGLANQLGAVLVLEVRRTESGRASDAVANAMVAAEITPANRKEVSEQLAGLVSKAGQDQVSDASVFYLQLPAKQFDVLYQKLWADEEGIESVRMAVAVDAPLLSVVDAIRPDPTSVQHESAVYELFSQSDAVNQLAHELSVLPYSPAERPGTATTMLGSGPDIQTQVLILVR